MKECRSLFPLALAGNALEQLHRPVHLLLRDALAKVPKWISVEERLPEPFVSVLVQMPGEEPHPTVREGFISDDGIWCAGHFKREPDEVTHWAKMPEPPKGRSAT